MLFHPFVQRAFPLHAVQYAVTQDVARSELDVLSDNKNLTRPIYESPNVTFTPCALFQQAKRKAREKEVFHYRSTSLTLYVEPQRRPIGRLVVSVISALI